MFTPGFRLFSGMALVGVIAAFVYGVASGDGGGVDYLGFVDEEAWTGALSLGWKGGVGDHTGYFILIMFSVVCAALAGLLIAFRDADAESVAELHDGELPPGQRPTGTDYWPAIGAFGTGVTIIGLVISAAIFVVGIIILVAAAFEWMISAWADRATGDPETNAELRSRIMRPVEVPVLGVLGVGALVLAVSRIFLTVSAAAAVWVATGIAAVIFLGAIVIASTDRISKNVIAAFAICGALGCLAAGIIAAAVGEREFELHEEGDEQHEEGESLADPEVGLP